MDNVKQKPLPYEYQAPEKVWKTLKKTKDAADFVQKRIEQVDTLVSLMDRKPIILCPYDAELFGHWWFEGPKFIEEVFRGISTSSIVSASPIDYLDMYPQNQKATPAFSSWGDKIPLRDRFDCLF